MCRLTPELRPPHIAGITLIELMIVIAIIAIMAAIAIPAYNGYVREARLGTARVNADSIRLFLEDYQLDNGSYVFGGGNGPTTYPTAAIESNYGWSSHGDEGQYSYSVTATSNSYDILVTHTATSDWVRCEDRMNNCCDGKAADSSAACP